MPDFEKVEINYGNIGTNILKSGTMASCLATYADKAARSFGKTAKSTKREDHGSRVAISVNCGQISTGELLLSSVDPRS